MTHRSIMVAVGIFSISFLVSCKPRANVSDVKADDYARAVLGPGAPYKAAPEGQNSIEQLEKSFKDRRMLGWMISHKIFEPAQIRNNPEGRYVPAWFTWYTSKELESMFVDLILAIPPEQRGQGVVPEGTLDCVLKRYSSEKRLKDMYGRGFKPEKIQQLQLGKSGGLNTVAKGVTFFNLPYIRHYLKHYASVTQCESTQGITDQPANEAEKFSCFGEGFPRDAVSIKSIWVHESEEIELWDTSANGIKSANSSDSWLQLCLKDGACKLPANDPKLNGRLHTVEVKHPDSSESKYHLAAMHITTKEFPEWTWTTLWWAANPGDDFGEDRPDWVGKYNGRAQAPLANYKMCNTIGFHERDQNLLAKLDSFDLDPSNNTLEHAALASYAFGDTSKGNPTTWCSNPYIEKDSGMVDSNCIGCHQAAGPNSDMEYTRTQVQKRFPADYSWAFTFIGQEFSNNDNFKGRMGRLLKELKGEDQISCTP